jgi:integrase
MNLKVYQPRQPQTKQPVGRRLTIKEVQLLRGSVDTTTAKGKRDLAILDVMLFLGLRREEVADLDLSAFRQDGGRWWTVFSGKRDKIRRLKVHDVLYQSLTGWLQAAGLELSTQGPVFRSFDRGDRVTSNGIDASVIGRLVSTYGYRSGLAPEDGPNQLSAHDLRRTCARNAFDNGASLLLVQAMLGHEDPKTTAHYIGAFDSDDDTAVDYVRY